MFTKGVLKSLTLSFQTPKVVGGLLLNPKILPITVHLSRVFEKKVLAFVLKITWICSMITSEGSDRIGGKNPVIWRNWEIFLELGKTHHFFKVNQVKLGEYIYNSGVQKRIRWTKIIAFTGWSQVDIFVGMPPGESSIVKKQLVSSKLLEATILFDSLRIVFFDMWIFARVEGKQPSLKKGVFPTAEQGVEQILFFPMKFEIFSEKDHLLKVALNPYPTLPPISPIIMVQWNIGRVSPIVDTFQLQPFSTEPWLWEKEWIN